MKSTVLFLIICIGFIPFLSSAQQSTCFAKLEGEYLIMGNSSVNQKWKWNNGDIKPYSITNLDSGKTILFNSKKPAFSRKELSFKRNIKFEVIEKQKSFFAPAHLEVLLENEYDGIILKRKFNVFPEVPAIACDYFLKYETLQSKALGAQLQATGAENTVFTKDDAENYLANYPLPGRHWQVKTIAFKDITDRNNNLVQENEVIPYNASNMHIGNLVFAQDLISEVGFFILKEAPNSESQINYPGYDFGISNKEIKVPFSGFPAKAINDGWIKGYTLTTGVCDNKTRGLAALRTYLKKSVNYSSDYYDMVMMNTWGDRGKDGRISEDFVLLELEKAHELGISVFQIDDGWQQGLSSNSAFKKEKENLWDAWTPENWLPNKERFPNGLEAVLKSAKEKNIELGLWFNPSKRDSYKTWESDADIIIGLNKRYGIKYFKIDGVAIPNKLAEVNFENFIKKIKEESNGEVFFNLDLTAGVRGGYFSFRYAGNLFLENRYTDWTNYFPFYTLKNVWMLSKYFPPEFLQIEFLNKWRNSEKYDANDLFAPNNYNFEYIFATTMAAQPLAWFESTGLPSEAFEIASTIKKYRTIQSDFHAGNIFPVGDQPSGRSWTGFQSIQDKRGYFLIYRENNDVPEKEMSTFLQEGDRIKLTKIIGTGENFKTEVGAEAKIKFKLLKPNSYALYLYEINEEK